MLEPLGKTKRINIQYLNKDFYSTNKKVEFEQKSPLNWSQPKIIQQTDINSTDLLMDNLMEKLQKDFLYIMYM